MTDSPRNLLLAADRGATPHLDEIRARVLEQEFRSRRSAFGWWCVAAAWILIALLKAFTPPGATIDPRSANLAHAQRLLSVDSARVLTRNFEPFESPRIP
jgi:hypothetical protein